MIDFAKSILARFFPQPLELEIYAPDQPSKYGILFSQGYYCSQVTGLAVEQAVEHFESVGWQQGLCPHPLFHTGYYLRQFEEKTQELENKNPLWHFIQQGWNENRNPHPLFDIAYYRKQLDQVAEQNLTTQGAGIANVSANGKHHAHISSDDPLTHYLQTGWKQSCSPHRMVSLYYCLRPQRPKAITGDPLTFCLRQHFKQAFRPHPLLHGGRLSTQIKIKDKTVDTQTLAEEFAHWTASTSPTPLFDQPFYVRHNPAAVDYPGGPFYHFVEVGQFQDRDPNPFFSHAFYRENYADQLAEAPSPFLHFMSHENSLKFNPCEDFDLAHYDLTNPGVKKSGKSLFEHFLNNGRYGSSSIHRDVIPKFLMDDIHEAAEIDPSIRFTPKQLRGLKVVNRHQSIKIAEHYEVLLGHLTEPFRVMVLMPFLKRGGADLVAANLVRCLHERFDKRDVLLVLTDNDDLTARNWLPPETRMVALSHLERTLSVRDREKILQFLIEEFRPEYCYNVNSSAAWELFTRQGRGISQLTSLRAFLFCFDYRELDKPVGYAMQHFPKAIDHLAEVYLDNFAFRRELISTFGIPPSKQDKLQVVYQPTRSFGFRVDTAAIVERLSRDDSYRRQVFWAGRLDRQKRPDVLLKIAQACPQFDFHVYGMRVLDNDLDFESTAPANVTFHGSFLDTFQLPLDQADMFLYTSQWDGLPTLLIDIMQAGIPTIAANTGGVSELVNAETGWMVDHVDNIDAYIQGLQEMAVSPELCLQKIETGCRLVKTQHHWEGYCQQILASITH
jgi:glycosyltransferase involved in cell wall biosynthesis